MGCEVRRPRSRLRRSLAVPRIVREEDGENIEY